MEARCSLSATQRAWDSGSPWHPIPDAHTSHRQIGEIRWIPAPFPTCSWSLEQGHVSPYHTEVSKSNLARCGSQENRCWPALCSPPQQERPGHPAIQSPHLQRTLTPLHRCSIWFPHPFPIHFCQTLWDFGTSKAKLKVSISRRDAALRNPQASSTAFTQEVTWTIGFCLGTIKMV